MPHPVITIRPATTDAQVITAHRRAMFFDMGHLDNCALDAMTAAFLPWLREKMRTAEYLAWIAHSPDESPVAGLGLWLMDWPPHMIGPGARRGNILNVYTDPRYRRMGIARGLMDVALDWCRTNGIGTVILHASPVGRQLYEWLGFEATNEMRLQLSPVSNNRK